MRKFPVVPKSNRNLEPGDYWVIQLAAGRFACARVLQVEGEQLPAKRQSFFGGLHRWVGSQPPTADDLRASGFVDYGVMHVRSIRETGDAIVGNVPLSTACDEIPILMDAMGGPGSQVLKGVKALRAATPSEWGRFPVLHFWGIDFVKQLAEHKLANEPP
jgi:hypothetical protein